MESLHYTQAAGSVAALLYDVLCEQLSLCNGTVSPWRIRQKHNLYCYFSTICLVIFHCHYSKQEKELPHSGICLLCFITYSTLLVINPWGIQRLKHHSSVYTDLPVTSTDAKHQGMSQTILNAAFTSSRDGFWRWERFSCSWLASFQVISPLKTAVWLYEREDVRHQYFFSGTLYH